MNRTGRTNPILKSLGSLYLTITILAVFAVAIAAATFLEVRWGPDGARAMVYGARWFELLLALFVINLTVSLMNHIPFSKTQTGFVITHIGFILVLIAGGITRYFGYEGRMSIREGASTDFIYSDEDYIVLSDGEMAASFPVLLYKPGDCSIRQTLVLGDERYRVSVREYWPRAAMRLVEGPGGGPVIHFATAAGESQTLQVGERYEEPGVVVHFLSEDRGSVEETTRYGELIVHLDGEVHRLDVPAEPPALLEAKRYRFRITEFASNFRVGQKPTVSDDMRNPAIRVEIEGPNGEKGERLLFAFHPDFDMGHAGGEHAFEELHLTYSYERNVYLFAGPSGPAGRADFALTAVPEGDQPQSNIAAGVRFELEIGVALHSGGFSFLPTAYWASAVERLTMSSDEDDPPAVRIVVEDEAGNQVEKTVFKWEDPVATIIGDHSLALSFGPARIDLPYALHLDDFLLVTYPGSENPASFESHVRIFDEQRGVDGRPVRIYMNHPLTYRGFKHFQSSYDRDRRGTVLSVNRDPGKLPTYVGYFLVGLGFLITLTRGLLWARKPAG